MSYFYLDASAVIKRYSREPGSDWIKTLTDVQVGHVVLLAEITLVEVAAALAAKHRASGGISQHERDNALNLFLSNCRSEYEIMPINRSIIDQAIVLTQNHRLRGYDAIQLASAIVVSRIFGVSGLPSLIFVTADADLLLAAEAEGLETENPNSYQ